MTRIKITGTQELRTALEKMSGRFAVAIQKAVEREARAMFKPLYRSTPGRRRSRRKRTR